MSGDWPALGAMVWKDVRIELRSRELVLPVAAFSLLMLLVFNFAFDMDSGTGREMAPAALWMAFLLGGLLGFGRAFASEREQGALDAVLVAPVGRSTIYLAKLAANTIFLASVELALVPLFAVLFDLPVLNADIAVTLLLGTVGYAAVGTLYSAAIHSLRAREVALPLLLLPIAIPILIAVVSSTSEGMGFDPPSGRPWWGLLMAFDLIHVTISAVLFGFVVTEG